MFDQLKKAAAIATIALTAAAPMAMAYGVNPDVNRDNLQASVAPIGTQPDLTQQLASDYNLAGLSKSVTVAPLGAHSTMPYLPRDAATSAGGSPLVSAENLALSAQVTH